jgi:hypothetical protein
MSSPQKSRRPTVGYRILPVRHRVWRWEVFALEDNRVLETREVAGSRVKAICFANSAARVFEATKRNLS